MGAALRVTDRRRATRSSSRSNNNRTTTTAAATTTTTTITTLRNNNTHPLDGVTVEVLWVPAQAVEVRAVLGVQQALRGDGAQVALQGAAPAHVVQQAAHHVARG
jgi:hypothetical protein